MKFKSIVKTNKKLLVSFGLLSCVGLVTLPIISCSKNNVFSLNNEEINTQFSKFYNSLIKSNIKNNLYFENFNFDNSTNKAILSIDEIGNIISIEKLSNAYQYQFEVSKNEEEKSIEIEMKMQLKNSTNNSFLNPLNEQYKVKKINNIKSLSSNQKSNLNSIYQNWQTNGANSLKITNIDSNSKLEKQNYQNILPSYLSLNNIKLNFDLQNNTSQDFVFDFNYNFNDINGTINASLDILNNETQLKYYVNNFQEVSQIQISGFANEKTRNTEIQNLYDTLSETFNLKTILDGKQIPFLASGVTTKQDVINLFQAIKNIKANTNIDKILEIINNTNSQNQWYEISLTTSASDIIGNIIIDWTIADKFTGYKIRPEYITKTTTINDMLQLVNSDDQGNKNYGIIDNVYQTYYKIFSQLNLAKINSQLASSITNSQTTINNDWLMNSTNIKKLLPNIANNNEYLEFDLTTNEIKSNFRLKLNLQESDKLLSNDISGVLSVPFVLEIKIENSDFSESNNWIKVLPPNGKSGVGENVSYNSAVREAYIQVGGFLTKDTQIASQIYNVFNKLENKTVTIEIEDQSYFEYIKQKSEVEIPTILKNEINNFIQSKITNQQNEVSNFLEKYSLSFGFTNNQVLNYDEQNKTISTTEVSLKILNSSDNFVIPFYENEEQKEFPIVQISIKLKQPTSGN